MKNNTKILILSILVSIAFILFLIFISIGVIEVTGNSMNPNLKNGDLLIISKLTYKFLTPNRNDIVVYKNTFKKENSNISRIIGIENDIIEIKNNIVYLNEEPLNEINIIKNNNYSSNLPKQKIPPKHVFLLSDNRSNSVDSRILGFIPLENITGVKINY